MESDSRKISGLETRDTAGWKSALRQVRCRTRLRAVKSTPQRICLVRLSALGDVCLAVPLVRTLQHAFPDAQITWVTTAPMLQLLEGLDGVEFVIAEKASHPFAYVAFYRRMRRRTFDVLLGAQASFRAHFLYPLVRAGRKIGFAKSEARDAHYFFVNEHVRGRREHLLDSFLAFAEALGATKRIVEWRLPVGPSDHAFAEKRLGSDPWVALNPMASKPERNWLPERYAAVIDACICRWDTNVVLTGGPSLKEREFGRDVLRRTAKPERVLDLIGQTTPKQLAALLGRTKALVAPDTGPVHIATAMGTPVVGLYAVARPELTGAYNSQHLVVNRFPEAVRTVLGKEAGEVSWKTRVKSPRAMELITVADVVTKLELLFEPAAR
jgi:heptosyltransferase I